MHRENPLRASDPLCEADHRTLAALLPVAGPVARGCGGGGDSLGRLRELGCVIDHTPDGPHLRRTSLNVWAEHIAWAVGCTARPERIRVYRRTTSTQDAARRSGTPDAIVVADEQTHGRGRRGRSWLARPGGAVLLSLAHPGPAEGLTPRVAVAIAEVVDELLNPSADGEEHHVTTGLFPQTRIKIPNDIVYCGKKVAGILLETYSHRGTAPGPRSVIGIGLNVEPPPPMDPRTPEETRTAPPLPATSLREMGIGHDRLHILTQLLLRLDRVLASGDQDAIEQAWARRVL